MSALFGNCEYSYPGPKGRPIFAPSEEGRAIGSQLKSLIEERYEFEDFFYHLGQDGGHVAALHNHRPNSYFAKVDLQRFFYSISRNRVKATLRAIGVRSAEHFARWSCVKNPYAPPSYSLPYGFVQSPILASLVLSRSAVGNLLRELAKDMTVSVYVDDIALSCNDLERIQLAYTSLREAIVAGNFQINEEKSIAPAPTIEVFNCSVTQDETLVTDDRQAEFFSIGRSDRSVESFEKYCDSVSKGNG